MGKNIRISDEAYTELVRRGKEEGRTLVVVLDRLLGVRGAEVPRTSEPARVAPSTAGYGSRRGWTKEK
jgi:hypothetical protein